MPNRFGVDIYELLTVTAVSALGGIVKQIVWPEQEVGLSGFCLAALTGIFSGVIVANIARAVGSSPDVVLVCCGIGSVMGFSFLRGVMSWIHRHQVNGQFTFTGPTNVQVGDQNTQFDQVDAHNVQTGQNAQVNEQKSQ